jgi:hypothetical protein
MTDNTRTSLNDLAGDLENEACNLTATVRMLLEDLEQRDSYAFGLAVSRLYVTASALRDSAKQLHSISAKSYITDPT